MQRENKKKINREERLKEEGKQIGREEGGGGRHTSTFIHLIYIDNFSKRKLLNSQLAHEKMFWVLSHQGKWKSKPHDVLHTHQDGCIQQTDDLRAEETAKQGPAHCRQSGQRTLWERLTGHPGPGSFISASVPKERKTFFTSCYHALWDVHTEMCTQVSIVTLFMMAKNGNHDCVHHLMNGYRKCGEEWEEGRRQCSPIQ